MSLRALAAVNEGRVGASSVSSEELDGEEGVVRRDGLVMASNAFSNESDGGGKRASGAFSKESVGGWMEASGVFSEQPDGGWMGASNVFLEEPDGGGMKVRGDGLVLSLRVHVVRGYARVSGMVTKC
jgi:hypothetical protein